MKTYVFTIWLKDLPEITEEIENKVFEAGCSDALLGMFDSRPFLTFDRKAESREDAIASALKDIAKAGLRIRYVQPDEHGTEGCNNGSCCCL